METNVYKTFKRYMKPAIIRPEDTDVMQRGIKEQQVDAVYIERFRITVAALTDAGYAAFREEEFRRNPLKRFGEKIDDLLMKAGPW